MGLFSCCIGDRKPTKSEADAEARHARIVEIYQQAKAETQTPVQLPPPSYNEVIYDAFTGTTTVIVDEKVQPALQQDPQSEDHHFRPRTAISRPGSPQTSIYSVPSTRLTDITSAHTGQTVRVVSTHQGDSPRSSLVFDSAPPSYYDGRSIRERSRSPNATRLSDEQQRRETQHPVMTDNWLELLLAGARHEERVTRNT